MYVFLFLDKEFYYKIKQEQDEARRYIEKLKNELAETKKESKKRRRMLETQQRMLMAQNSNYHTVKTKYFLSRKFFVFIQCPVCTHAFLSIAYLQAHMSRRHPDYDFTRRREHDVDVEKQIQLLKDQLNKKDNELQLIKVQKVRSLSYLKIEKNNSIEILGK